MFDLSRVVFSILDDFMGECIVEPGCVRQVSLDCCQIPFVSFGWFREGHFGVLQNWGWFVDHTLGVVIVVPVENLVVFGELGIEELGFSNGWVDLQKFVVKFEGGCSGL